MQQLLEYFWILLKLVLTKCNFKQPPSFINYAKFSISSRGPQSWNRILAGTEKNISNLLIFKARIKQKLSTYNELDYFQVQEVNKKHPKDNTYIYFAFKGAWWQGLNNLLQAAAMLTLSNVVVRIPSLKRTLSFRSRVLSLTSNIGPQSQVSDLSFRVSVSEPMFHHWDGFSANGLGYYQQS